MKMIAMQVILMTVRNMGPTECPLKMLLKQLSKIKNQLTSDFEDHPHSLYSIIWQRTTFSGLNMVAGIFKGVSMPPID